jgi:hypothetical protein
LGRSRTGTEPRPSECRRKISSNHAMVAAHDADPGRVQVHHRLADARARAGDGEDGARPGGDRRNDARGWPLAPEVSQWRGWSFFVCPSCGRRARVLKLFEKIAVGAAPGSKGSLCPIAFSLATDRSGSSGCGRGLMAGRRAQGPGRDAGSIGVSGWSRRCGARSSPSATG